MPTSTDRYYVTDGDDPEREVTREEYCRAEREAGFRPKGLPSTDPAFLTTPATASFGTSGPFTLKMAGRIVYGQPEIATS